MARNGSNKQSGDNISRGEQDYPQRDIKKNEQVYEEMQINGKGEQNSNMDKLVDENVEKEFHEKEEETYESLKNDLEALSREKKETVDLLQRVQADFDNFRKRTAAEKEEIRNYALFEFIGKIIPVLDNLDRALESAQNKEVPQTYIDGLDMIRKQISKLLEQQGVSPIEATGGIFDPHYHEAVMQTDEGEGEPNTVVDEFQRGYLIKGRVLRPAMVKVYTGGNPSSTTEE